MVERLGDGFQEHLLVDRNPNENQSDQDSVQDHSRSIQQEKQNRCKASGRRNLASFG